MTKGGRHTSTVLVVQQPYGLHTQGPRLQRIRVTCHHWHDVESKPRRVPLSGSRTRISESSDAASALKLPLPLPGSLPQESRSLAVTACRIGRRRHEKGHYRSTASTRRAYRSCSYRLVEIWRGGRPSSKKPPSRSSIGRFGMKKRAPCPGAGSRIHPNLWSEWTPCFG